MAMVLTATATTIGAMNNFFTLFLMPMFYLSGTFFPLERLPSRGAGSRVGPAAHPCNEPRTGDS